MESSFLNLLTGNTYHVTAIADHPASSLSGWSQKPKALEPASVGRLPHSEPVLEFSLTGSHFSVFSGPF